MKTRIIHTKFWRDEYCASLSEGEKILFMYLITNEKINICGVYEITNREISFDTGFEEEALLIAKKKFQEDKKFYFFNNWVAVINCWKYQDYKGPKNLIAGQKEMLIVPEKFRATLCQIGYRYTMDKVSDDTNTPINPKQETNNNSLETEDILNGLREKYGSKKAL